MKKYWAPRIVIWFIVLLTLYNTAVIMAQLPLLRDSVRHESVTIPARTVATEQPLSMDKTFGTGVPALPPAKVRIGYVVPSNRTPQPHYKENLQFAVEMAQMWYRNNMLQNGFGPKTFIYETEEESPRPKIHLVNVPETDDYLWGGNGNVLFERTKIAAKNVGLTVDFEGELWILIPETHVQNPDGSFYGGLALGGGGGSGKNSGLMQLGSTVIQLFNPQRLLDNTPYAGQTVPEWGPYPLVQNTSFMWFEGETFSSVASSYLGALCHEMGHAFGLSHDARHDNNAFGGLMYNGLRGIRGSFFPTLYPKEYTRLEYGSSVQLNESHYFNRIKTVNSAPSLTILTSTILSPVDGLLNISFNAADADSISYAQLFDYQGNVIDELVFEKSNSNPTSVIATFKTPYYTAGQNNTFSISVCDRQGNRKASSAFTLNVTEGNQAPKPFLKLLYPTTANTGPFTRFDATTTTDPDGDSFTVEFDVNNDGIFDTPPLNTHYFDYIIPQQGPYHSRIRVTDARGASAISSPISGNYGNTCGVDAPTISGIPEVCPGASVTLSAYGCYGTYLWTTGETSSSIIVTPNATTNYSVTCTYGCNSLTSTPFTVSIIADTVSLTGTNISGIERTAGTLISTQNIPDKTNGLYIANNSVTLLPGFQAQRGSTFTALLKGCSEPIAHIDNSYAGGGVAQTISILTNDQNPDGTAVTNLTQISLPTLVTSPTKGTVTVNPNGSLNYFSNEKSGTDRFVYAICNRSNPSSCSQAQVTVNLQPYFSPLSNSNFEDSVSFVSSTLTLPWLKAGWKIGQGVFSWLRGQGRNGSNCIKIYSGPAYGSVQSNDLQVYQTIRVIPYTNYILKGWIKTQDITTQANSNGVGANLSVVTSTSNPSFPPRSKDLKGTNDWTLIQLPFNSGDGYVKITCRLGFTSGDCEGTAYFDDLTLEMLK